MQKIVNKFFSEHPTATNCFVALGIAKETFEDALALLGGIKYQYVRTFTREGEVAGSDIDQLLKAFDECSEAENNAQQVFEKVPSEDNMLKWKGAQKSSQLAMQAFHNLIAKKQKAAEKANADKFIDEVMAGKEQPVVTDQPTVTAEAIVVAEVPAVEAEQPVVSEQPSEEVK